MFDYIIRSMLLWLDSFISKGLEVAIPVIVMLVRVIVVSVSEDNSKNILGLLH